MIPKEDYSAALERISKDYSAATEALHNLQAKLAEAPKEDWRASMAWEAIEEGLQELAKACSTRSNCPSSRTTSDTGARSTLRIRCDSICDMPLTTGRWPR